MQSVLLSLGIALVLVFSSMQGAVLADSSAVKKWLDALEIVTSIQNKAAKISQGLKVAGGGPVLLSDEKLQEFDRILDNLKGHKITDPAITVGVQTKDIFSVDPKVRTKAVSDLEAWQKSLEDSVTYYGTQETSFRELANRYSTAENEIYARAEKLQKIAGDPEVVAFFEDKPALAYLDETWS